MPFLSILFPADTKSREAGRSAEPACFPDLALDQVVAAVTAGLEEYDLAPLFYAPLSTVQEVTYRQAVVRDLDGTPLAEMVSIFARRMRRMRAQLAFAAKLRHHRQKQAWFLEGVRSYVAAVAEFADSLTRVDLRSEGMRQFAAYLAGYARSQDFCVLREGASTLNQELVAIEYGLLVSVGRIDVSRYDGEDDYGA